jgi:hypothetical protein
MVGGAEAVVVDMRSAGRSEISIDKVLDCGTVGCSVWSR